IPAFDGSLRRGRGRERGALRTHIPPRAPRAARHAARGAAAAVLPAGHERPRLVAHHRHVRDAPSRRGAHPRRGDHPARGLPVLAVLYSLPRAQLPAPLQALLRQTVGEHIVLLDVEASIPLYSDEARELVRQIRALTPPAGGELLVTGFTAIDLDTVNFIVGKTPGAVLFVMLATIVVLFVLLGSVVLPLKAVVMNLLSISASFGALVFVFQDGHGASFLGFEQSAIDPSTPVIMFCIVFGLSMDYEVLL